MFEGCGGCCLALILIPVLCCVMVACGVIYVYSNAPDAPLSDRFKPSVAEAQAFDAEISRATTQARTSGSGWFVLQFTERELSSWMALEGEQYAEENGHSFPFEDVQVGLDDGEMTFYGELEQSHLTLPVKVVIKPGVDGSGHFEFDITSVDVGGLSAPGFVLNSLSDQFADVLAKPFEDLPGNYTLYEQTLVIQDGTFAVQGNRR